MDLRCRWIWLSALGLVACSAGATEGNGLTFGSGLGSGEDTAGSDTSIPSETEGSGGISAGESDSADGGTTTDDPTGDDEGTSGASADCSPGETVVCYAGPANTQDIGECQSGTQICGEDGAWGACTGEIIPASELCNGLDDDCNGTADDGNPGGGGGCNTGLLGPCAAGTNACVGGNVICQPDTPAAAVETCGDNIDNDCNGTPDDGCSTTTICDPMNPSAECGGGEHCFPTTTGDTSCEGPTGLGTQYGACLSDGDCGAGHVCVDTGLNTYCLQWCTSFVQCPFVLDDCLSLDTPVFAGAQEYGVCYDGLG